MSTIDSNVSLSVEKFNGNAKEHFVQCKLRVECALKGKAIFRKIQDSKEKGAHDQACSIIVSALDDDQLRLWMNDIEDSIKLLKVLEESHASNRTVHRVALISSIYPKNFTKDIGMGKYINGLNSLFSQLASMEDEYIVPESHKPNLVMASICKESGLESTLAALRVRDIDKLTWKSVGTDLIKKWKTFNPSEN